MVSSTELFAKKKAGQRARQEALKNKPRDPAMVKNLSARGGASSSQPSTVSITPATSAAGGESISGTTPQAVPVPVFASPVTTSEFSVTSQPPKRPRVSSAPSSEGDVILVDEDDQGDVPLIHHARNLGAGASASSSQPTATSAPTAEPSYAPMWSL